MEGAGFFTWSSVTRHMTYTNFFLVLVLSALGFWLSGLVLSICLVALPAVFLALSIGMMFTKPAPRRGAANARPKKNGKDSTKDTSTSSLWWLWSCLVVWGLLSLSLPLYFFPMPFLRARVHILFHVFAECPSRFAMPLRPVSFFGSCFD